MYSPTLGRWIQNDPIGFAAGDPDLYRFVSNNPANEVDPTGLQGAYDPGRRGVPGFNDDPAEYGKTELTFPGTAAMAAMGFNRYESIWPGSDYTDQYTKMRMGCVGLNMVRLNTRSPLEMPNLSAYVDLAGAIAAQQRLVATVPKDTVVVLFAMQSPAPKDGMTQYLKPGSTTEYRVPDVGGARTAAGGQATTFDFATAFQNKDGSVKYWEVMPYGVGSNPRLDVVHKKSLYPETKMGTAYFVVPIPSHRFQPQCPCGTAK